MLNILPGIIHALWLTQDPAGIIGHYGVVRQMFEMLQFGSPCYSFKLSQLSKLNALPEDKPLHTTILSISTVHHLRKAFYTVCQG